MRIVIVFVHTEIYTVKHYRLWLADDVISQSFASNLWI